MKTNIIPLKIKKMMEAKIEVLTQEQIGQFSETVRENIEMLSTGVNAKELIKFNPLVSGLLSLKEQASKLKMLPAVDGNWSKVNIQEFIDLKKDIKTYRAGVKRVADALKRPRLDQNKAIGSIKTTFIDEATALFDGAEKEFAPYVEAEIEKARLAKEKKDKAFNDKIAEQAAELEEQRKKNESSKVFNFIKYSLIAENISNTTNHAVIEANESTLVQLQGKLIRETFENLTKNQDLEFISDPLIAELKQSFLKAKRQSIAIIGEKLESLSIVKEMSYLEAKNEAAQEHIKHIATKIDEAIPPVIPTPPNHGLALEVENTDDAFIKSIISSILPTLNIVEARLLKKPLSIPQLYKLKDLLTLIKNIK